MIAFYLHSLDPLTHLADSLREACGSLAGESEDDRRVEPLVTALHDDGIPLHPRSRSTLFKSIRSKWRMTRDAAVPTRILEFWNIGTRSFDFSAKLGFESSSFGREFSISLVKTFFPFDLFPVHELGENGGKYSEGRESDACQWVCRASHELRHVARRRRSLPSSLMRRRKAITFPCTPARRVIIITSPRFETINRLYRAFASASGEGGSLKITAWLAWIIPNEPAAISESDVLPAYTREFHFPSQLPRHFRRLFSYYMADARGA